MMPRDTNAIESHKYHCGKVVTVSMDKIEFKHPVHVGDLLSCFTDTLRIGRTSIPIANGSKIPRP